jgi:hypothetical protein
VYHFLPTYQNPSIKLHGVYFGQEHENILNFLFRVYTKEFPKLQECKMLNVQNRKLSQIYALRIVCLQAVDLLPEEQESQTVHSVYEYLIVFFSFEKVC